MNIFKHLMYKLSIYNDHIVLFRYKDSLHHTCVTSSHHLKKNITITFTFAFESNVTTRVISRIEHPTTYLRNESTYHSLQTVRLNLEALILLVRKDFHKGGRMNIFKQFIYK